MPLSDAFADKAAEGKTRVLEFGVYVLETLGAVGLPAEQVAAALLSFRPTPSIENQKESEKKGSGGIGGSGRKKKKKRRRKSTKNRDSSSIIHRDALRRRHVHAGKNNDL